MSKKVIVLGNDHTNTLGVIQALGKEGVYVIAVLWGTETGIVKSSCFTKEIIHKNNSNECINAIIPMKKNDDKIVIVPCTDEAAVVLENNAVQLKGFLFQYCNNYSISELENKEIQTHIAKESGLFYPKSWEIKDIDNLPTGIPFPCIIKPVISTEGSTKDIIVIEDDKQLFATLSDILPRTGRILVQQYITKDSDYGVVGCRLKDGTVIIPDIINRPRIFPPKTGLGTIYELQPMQNPDLKKGIEKYVNIIDYVGLFSLEFAKSSIDGNYYFIEANFRNDGENPCLVKAGLNVLYVHYCDLLDIKCEWNENIRTHTAISEIRHLKSMKNRQITLKQWLTDIFNCDSFMTYYKEDKKPFFKLLSNRFWGRFRKK